MKTILLMRHAEAGEAMRGTTDFDRSLTDDGITVAGNTGSLLESLKIKLDKVICSSAARTHETASIVAAVVSPEVAIVSLDGLYNAAAEAYATAVAQQMFDDESCALVVGHNPGIAALMCRWSGQSLSVPPATLTIFRLPSVDWSTCIALHASRPKLHCIIQDGSVIWTEPNFETSIETAE